jgi:hypothetical protein
MTMTIERTVCQWCVPSSEAMRAARQIEDSQAAARVLGLMSVLSLPPLRRLDGTWAKAGIEIEIEPGVWQAVDRIVIEERRLIFLWGFNGHSGERSYDRERVPEWREIRASVRP